MTDRCGCSNPGVLGCLCSLIDTECINVSGAGTVASPYTLAPDFDPDADNLLTCGASGLLAEFTDVLPQCDAGNGTATLTTNVEAAISFTAEVYDTDTMHSDSVNPSRITATTAGIYIVTAFCSFLAADPDGARRLTIRQDGANRRVEKAQADTFWSGLTLCTIVHLAATNYVEVLAFQDTGGDVFVGAGFKATMLAPL